MALKKKTPKDEKYLRYIRGLGWCCVCGEQPGPVDAHHHSVPGVTQKGMGMKVTDYATIPLCRIHHTEGHAIGWGSLEATYDIDLVGVMIGCLQFWLRSQPKAVEAKAFYERLTGAGSVF